MQVVTQEVIVVPYTFNISGDTLTLMEYGSSLENARVTYNKVKSK